jgi:thiamine kinase-like enzyme
MYSNGMLLKEITDCMEAYELFMDSVSQSASAASQVGLTEDDLSEMRRQFEKLKCCDPFLLLQNLRRPSKQGNLTTIIHGEMWEKNILLDANYNAKILDWKNAKLASATLDLAFFLLSSTNWDVRVEGTKNLLLSYHEVYCKTITKLCPQIPEPTYEDLEEDYYISIQYATLQVVI